MSSSGHSESPDRRAPASTAPGGRDSLLLEGLGPVAILAALVLFASVLVGRVVPLPEEASRSVQGAHVLSGLVLLALGIALGRGAVAAPWAGPVAAFVAALAAGNGLAALGATGDPGLVVYSLLVIVGCGAFMRSWPWLAAVAGSIALASAAVLALHASGGELSRYGLALLAAAGLSASLFAVRQRMVRASVAESERETERRHRLEAALGRSEAHRELAVAASQGAWWSVEMDALAPGAQPAGALLSAARAEALGHGPEVMAWDGWRRQIHPEDFRAIEEAVARHREGVAALFEACYRIRARGERWRWVEVRGAVERDASGRDVRWCGLDWDVSQRELARARLEHHRQIAEASPNPILLTDAHGMIEYVNPSFVRVTGYSAEEVLGKSPLMFDSEATPNETHEEAWAMITAGHEWQGEFENRHKNGARYRVRVSISPIRTEAGVISHFLLIHQSESGAAGPSPPGDSGLRSSAPY